MLRWSLDLIVKALKNEFGEVGVIPQNTPQSLDSLVKTHEVEEAFPAAHEFELIKQKGVYPYAYMDIVARFDESRLPSQDALFSKLSNNPCLDTEYAHTTQVWTAFECESIADYHDIYMKCDVLLLAEFLENFRAICLTYYILDAVHYYTAPGLAWDAALRMTHVSLELITDIDT